MTEDNETKVPGRGVKRGNKCDINDRESNGGERKMMRRDRGVRR